MTHELADTAHFETLLPAPSASVLLSGAKPDDVASQLVALGYNVISVTPTSAAGEVGASDATIATMRQLTDTGAIVALVLVDYRPATEPLTLFNSAFECLSVGGALVLRLPASSDAITHSIGEQQIGYLQAIAQRCGFEAIASSALPRVIVNGAVVVALRKVARPPRWRLVPLLPGDIDQFIDLFQEAFNTTISADLWQWKYGEGRGRSLLVRRAGKAVAHYGATLRSALFQGHPYTALQVCDVMVEPRERGVMTKKGATFLMTATFLEIYLGLQSFHAAFGFPSRRSARLGEKLGLYAEVGKMMEMRWTAMPDRPRVRTRLRWLRPCNAADAMIVDRLWFRMSYDLREAIVVVRDWNYLKYRYFDHPHHKYEVILVTKRFSGAPLGIVVLRKLDTEVELLDVVAPLKNLTLLVDHARRLTGRWELTTIFCWITKPHTGFLGERAAQVRDLDISVPTNAWVPGLPAEELRDKWWLMSGDTDFH